MLISARFSLRLNMTFLVIYAKISLNKTHKTKLYIRMVLTPYLIRASNLQVMVFGLRISFPVNVITVYYCLLYTGCTIATMAQCKLLPPNGQAVHTCDKLLKR